MCDRRIKRLIVSNETLFHILSKNDTFKIQSKLPSDAKMVGSYHDPKTDFTTYTVESEEFESIKSGDIIPELRFDTVKFTEETTILDKLCIKINESFIRSFERRPSRLFNASQQCLSQCLLESILLEMLGPPQLLIAHPAIAAAAIGLYREKSSPDRPFTTIYPGNGCGSLTVIPSKYVSSGSAFLVKIWDGQPVESVHVLNIGTE